MNSANSNLNCFRSFISAVCDNSVARKVVTKLLTSCKLFECFVIVLFSCVISLTFVSNLFIVILSMLEVGFNINVSKSAFVTNALPWSNFCSI